MGDSHPNGTRVHIGMMDEVAVCWQQQCLSGFGLNLKEQVSGRGVDVL